MGRGTSRVRTGYEVVRIPLNNGHASGIYEDFLTGFVTARRRRLGPSGGCGDSTGRVADGDRRRIEIDLAR